MKKKRFNINKLFYIFILLFTQTTFFSAADNTADQVDKNENSLLIFTTKELISSSFYSDNNELNNLSFYKLNEVDLTYYTKKENLSFLFYFNEKAIISFNKFALYDDNFESFIVYHDESERVGLVFQNAFSNIFSVGMEKEIELKNIMKLNLLNFKFILNTPFDDYYSLLFIPYLKCSGDYFFGLNWTLNESFVIEIFPSPIVNYAKYTQSSYLYLAYEFFRFYGPTNFKWTIYAENKLDFIFSYANTLKNELNMGLFFNFYGFKPIIYFLMESYCDTYPFRMTNNYVGLNTGLEYEIKWFLLSISYEGKIDYIPDDEKLKKLLWISSIDLSCRFRVAL